ncbi:MAG: hypothetical protein WDO74_09545 [Pseudomonadota bacterium]
MKVARLASGLGVCAWFTACAVAALAGAQRAGCQRDIDDSGNGRASG